MKERILTGWTLKRALYLVMGIYLIIQSVVDSQLLFILFGLYFAAMGLFAFSCASGNCYSHGCNFEAEQKSKNVISENENINAK